MKRLVKNNLKYISPIFIYLKHIHSMCMITVFNLYGRMANIKFLPETRSMLLKLWFYNHLINYILLLESDVGLKQFTEYLPAKKGK